LKETKSVDVEKVSGDAREAVRDDVVVEEPLEIRVSGETLAVTMRTPGHDRELVLGFLLAEGIIRSADDVSGLAHCEKVDDDARGNVIEVVLAPGVRLPDSNDEPFARRGTITTSACGVCGRRSIDDLLARVAPLPDGDPVNGRALASALGLLRERQPIFAATGGCHAASLVRLDGAHVATFEDVGRHNAVDKVIGSRLRAGTGPLGGHALLVSGRSSFEIVQKSVAAGIAVVASVSAASSLAVEVARRANVTLLGFTRGDSFTVYAGAKRVI
jgi:FdhD protein